MRLFNASLWIIPFSSSLSSAGSTWERHHSGVWLKLWGRVYICLQPRLRAARTKHDSVWQIWLDAPSALLSRSGLHIKISGWDRLSNNFRLTFRAADTHSHVGLCIKRQTQSTSHSWINKTPLTTFDHHHHYFRSSLSLPTASWEWTGNHQRKLQLPRHHHIWVSIWLSSGWGRPCNLHWNQWMEQHASSLPQ